MEMEAPESMHRSVLVSYASSANRFPVFHAISCFGSLFTFLILHEVDDSIVVDLLCLDVIVLLLSSILPHLHKPDPGPV